MRRALTYLTATLLSIASCANLNYTPRKFHQKNPSAINPIPDRVKLGVDWPAFLHFDNLDSGTNKLKKTLSPLSPDFNPKTLEQMAKRGEFMFPQSEFEYFPENWEDTSISIRLGGYQFNNRGREDFHIGPIGIKARTTADIDLFVAGLTIDKYVQLDRDISLSLGFVSEGHIYRSKGQTKINALGIPIITNRKTIEGWGISAGPRAGIEFPLPLIPVNNLRASINAEYHLPLYESRLGKDVEGLRLIFYLVFNR